MRILLIFNHYPYDGSDIAWNSLRLAETLLNSEHDVRIFLMNDAVDLARNETIKPEGYDKDLVQMLKALVDKGLKLRVCGTCMARCGIHKNKPYFMDGIKATMKDLADWTVESDKVISF